MAVQEQVLEKDNKKLAFTYTRLAHIYQHKKAFTKAEPLFLKALNIALKNFSNANENSKVAVQNYIACIEAQGKPTADLKVKYGFNPK